MNSEANTTDPAANAWAAASVAPDSSPAATVPAEDGGGDAAIAARIDPQYLPQLMWTPDVDRASTAALEWVLSDLPGGAFAGLPLVGKSHFLLYLANALARMLGRTCAVVRWSLLGLTDSNKEDLLRTLMLQVGCRQITARSFAVLRGRLIEHLLDSATAVGARRFVALIDEIQNLPEQLYEVVRSITGKLQEEGLTPCVVSAGQINLAQQIDQLYAQGQVRVAGRFYAEANAFNALSVDDAIETLANLEGPTRAFTSKWFPHLFDRGWSLGNLGVHVRSSVARMASTKGLTQEPLLPFGYFRPACMRMMRLQASLGDKNTGLNQEQVHSCLNHPYFMQVIHQYAKET